MISNMVKIPLLMGIALHLISDRGYSEPSVAVGYELFGQSPYPLQSQSIMIAKYCGSYHRFDFRISETKDRILMTGLRYREVDGRFAWALNDVLSFPLGVGMREVALEESRDEARAVTAVAGTRMLLPLIGPFVGGIELFGYSKPIYWLKKADPVTEGDDPKSDPYIREAYRGNKQVLRVYVELEI